MKIKIEIDTSGKGDDIIEISYDESKENKVVELSKGKKICDELFDYYHKLFGRMII